MTKGPCWMLHCVLAMSLMSCTHSIDTHLTGTHPFPVKPHQIMTLNVAKNDPNGATPWMASLRRVRDHWTIESTTATPVLLDHPANDTLIEHLLDTLATVSVLRPGPQGPLAAFGLETPRFALRWTTEAGGPMQEFQVGAASKDGGEVFLTMDHHTVWVATGSFFNILDQIDSWQSLRSPSWVSESPDDVDEVEVHGLNGHGRGGSTVYAQRDGDRWNDAKHHPVRFPVDSVLQKLMTTHWKEIIDEPVRAKQLGAWTQDHPDYEVTLRGRMHAPIVLDLKLQHGRGSKMRTLYGVNRARLPGVFALSAEVLPLN